MKNILTLLSAILFFKCSNNEVCHSKINHLPKYGNFKKCKNQLIADSLFLESCQNSFSDKREASNYYAQKGWDYFYSQKYDTAMFRFNQAWLLDSLNFIPYWGFANLSGNKKDFKGAIFYHNVALKLEKNNKNLWLDAANSYMYYFEVTKSLNLTDTAINYTRKALELNPNDSISIYKLAQLFEYINFKDSSVKYFDKIKLLK
ncbi:MAG: hypothetical protein EAZ53_07100 [Bacteroidetes bacterium]|nr:MAG: hypothetical protein EAZ53_07100 [Bacteroidota bacterium]